LSVCLHTRHYIAKGNAECKHAGAECGTGVASLRGPWCNGRGQRGSGSSPPPAPAGIAHASLRSLRVPPPFTRSRSLARAHARRQTFKHARTHARWMTEGTRRLRKSTFDCTSYLPHPKKQIAFSAPAPSTRLQPVCVCVFVFCVVYFFILGGGPGWRCPAAA